MMKARKAFTLIELLVVIAIIAILAAILFPVFSKVRENARKITCVSNLKQQGLGLIQYYGDYDEVGVPYQNEGGMKKVSGGTAGADGFVTTWDRLIQPYVKSNQVTGCASDGQPGTNMFPKGGMSAERAYSMPGNMGGNWCLKDGAVVKPPSISQIPAPAQTIYLTERDNCAAGAGSWGDDPHPVWGWCSVNDAESETAWRHNDSGNFLFVDGHAKAVHYLASSAKGQSSGGHSSNSGVYRFPGYDWSKTDGSLWGAWNRLPGGAPLVQSGDVASYCKQLPIDTPGDQVQ